MENNLRKKIAVIHHNKDMDGITSGCLAINIFNKLKELQPDIEVDVIGYNYEKDPKKATWLEGADYDYIQFIDVTPPLSFIGDNTEKIKSGELKIDIFDHHKSAYDEIGSTFIMESDHFNFFFNSSQCGAMIYWQTLVNGLWFDRIISKNKPKKKYVLFGEETDDSNIKHKLLKEHCENIYWKNDTLRLFIFRVSSYDIWAWYENNDWSAYNVNEGFMSMWNNRKDSPSKVFDFYQEIFESDLSFRVSMLSYWEKEGALITNVTRNQANRVNLQIVNYNGVEIVMLNTQVDFFITERVKKSFPDVVAVVYFRVVLDDMKVNISVRATKNDTDCISLVRELTNGNGGGHMLAAGGSVSITEFFDKLSNL